MFPGQKDNGRRVFSYPRGLPVKARAFTLLEILICSAILAIIFTGLLVVFRAGDFSNSAAMAKHEAQEEARRVLYWIIKDARQTSGSQISGNQPSSSHIKFKVCQGYDGDNIIWSDDYIEYTYNSLNQRLTRTDYNTGQSWDFENIVSDPFGISEIVSDNKLSLSITVQRQRQGLPLITSALTTQVKMRNE